MRYFVSIAIIAVVTGVFFSTLACAQPNIPTALQHKLDRKISLDLRDMNVVDSYKFLAMKGNFNISISKNVEGRVTLTLKDVSIKDALDIISIANNLGYQVMGDNVIHVMSEAEYMDMVGEKFGDRTDVKIVYLRYAKPAYVLEALKSIKSELGKIVIDEDTGSVVMIDTDENIKKMENAITEMDHPLQSKVYSLRYADAEDIAQKLKAKLEAKAVGFVQADARSNQIIVQAFPGRMKEVDQFIKAFDKKTRAVSIEIRILKVVFNPKFDAGVNWEAVIAASNAGHVRKFSITGNFPIASSITSSVGQAVGFISAANVGIDSLSNELKLLKQVAETKVLANPRLMVLDGKEARIHIGDKLAYVTTTTIGTGESQRVNEEIHYIDVGVQFKVTPKINDDGYITMAIKPEISSKADTLTTPQGAEIPLINSTLVETSVIVKDAETIIIAGLRKDDISSTRKGIPRLMDLPLIGGLFANQSRSVTKTEIAILLTPKILSGDENIIDQQANDFSIRLDK